MVSNPLGDQVIHTSVALGIIDTFAVAFRLLARSRSTAAFAADDALAVASLIPMYAMIVIGHFGKSDALATL